MPSRLHFGQVKWQRRTENCGESKLTLIRSLEWEHRRRACPGDDEHLKDGQELPPVAGQAQATTYKSG
jgi:hypothetical protein